MANSTNPIKPRNRLSTLQGAERAGCSHRHFLKLIYDEKIPSYMAAGHRWVDEEDIDKYFERQKAAGPQFRRYTGKRPTGRPRKIKSEPSAAAE